MAKKSSERDDALALANKLLEQPYADPDDGLRMLSRQLLRGQEVIDQLKREINATHDPYGDLIAANRDVIMNVYQEALRRLVKLLQCITPLEMHTIPKYRELCLAVVEAAQMFHPMHSESWIGWPEGTDLPEKP